VGAFSGVENAKMWGSSPEMPKTGSPLAKGKLVGWARQSEIYAENNYYVIVTYHTMTAGDI
jgi:hypothetical protein